MSGVTIKSSNIESIKPYEKSPKKHPDSQVAMIAASIKEFGFNVPVLIDKDHVIIAGYGRYLAAKKLGLPQVPTVLLESLSPDQVKKFRLADNKVAESKWDEVLLCEELLDIKESGYGVLDIPGFSEAEINKLLKGAQDNKGLTDPDEVPAQRDDHGIVKGDLFLLGSHRLLCGDSTSLGDVERLLDGGACQMCFTDPPYNVNYQGGSNGKRRKIENDNMSSTDFYQFMDKVYELIAQAMVPGGAFYICHADSMWQAFRGPLADHGLIFRQCLMWVKSQFVLSRADYHYRHEPILYGHKEGKRHFWNGGRDKGSVMFHQVPSIVVEEHENEKLIYINSNDSTIIISVPEYSLVYQDDGMESVWHFSKPDRSPEHPTMKPVELVKRAVRNSSAPGEAVYDPFLGSGSTLIACEDLGRCCFGLELSPFNCDVIVRRWEAYTGEKAVLIKTGSKQLDVRECSHV